MAWVQVWGIKLLIFNGFELFLNKLSLVRVAPLNLLPTEQQEERKSIYNSNSLTQIDLKSGIIGSLLSLDEGWRRWVERGGNREEERPAGCRQRRKVSSLFSSVSWSTPRCTQEQGMLVAHLWSHSWLCDLFIVTGEQPLGEVGVLPCTPFQCLTQLGPTTGSFRLWFTERSAKGLNYGLKFPKVFLVCLKYLCLQQFRPVYVSFFACWVKSSLAFTMCLYTGF